MEKYLSHFDVALEYCSSHTLTRLRRVRPVKRVRVSSGMRSSSCGSGSLGAFRLSEIRGTLESGFDMQRSNTQKRFHDFFLNACARFLFREDTNAPDYSQILKTNNWEDLRQQVLCMTPRRFGKTTAVAMYVAALAWHVPSEQAIFSTGRRASSKLLEQVAMLLGKLPNSADRIVKSNQEMLWVSHPGGRMSKISSYPSCAKTLRGVGGDVVYMEEAAFMDLDVFYQVIVPLLEMDATALICISTPQDNLNFYSEMFTMKGPDGKELFRSIQVGLACAACLAAGKGDSCTHNEDEIPPWKSREKFDMIKSLYGDRKDLLLRESVGAITEDQSSLFPSHWVDLMFDQSYKLPRTAVKHVIVACDPNGGGDSHMAIVSCAFVGGAMHIVGLDSHPVRGHVEIETLLMAHIKQLRAVFLNCWFIFVGESNLGQEADHMAFMLKDEGYVHCVTENGLAGVRTTNKRKELYSMELSKFMSQNACRVDADVVVANPNGVTKQATLDSFRKQMLGYRKIVLKSSTGRSEPRVCYTGKSQGANDDLVVTLTIAAYWGVQFYSRRIASVPYDIISVV